MSLKLKFNSRAILRTYFILERIQIKETLLGLLPPMQLLPYVVATGLD